MNLRRVIIIEGENLGTYVHSARIGVVTKLVGGDEELAKDLAMHVAANSPQFVKPEDVSAEVVAHEREIQVEIAINSGKPKEIAEKITTRPFRNKLIASAQLYSLQMPCKGIADINRAFT